MCLGSPFMSGKDRETSQVQPGPCLLGTIRELSWRKARDNLARLAEAQKPFLGVPCVPQCQTPVSLLQPEALLHDQGRIPAKRLWLPLVFAILGFAANSLLCRAALRGDAIDPWSFTALRLSSGALFFVILLQGRHRDKLVSPCWWRTPSWTGALSLFAYALFFSLSYRGLSAGIGALILFGTVQVELFGVVLVKREAWSPYGLCGWALAVAGLIVLTEPWKATLDFGSALLMSLAGAAWALYTLMGRKAQDAVEETARNFLFAALPALIMAAVFSKDAYARPYGLWLALISGVLASGAAYTLWYQVLPALSRQQAGLFQLLTPVLAALGGVLLLGEDWSLKLLIAMMLILGGIGLALAQGSTDRARKPRT